MDFATHHILVTVYWSDDSGAYGSDEWNLADPNRVYGFYPGNSNSTITFIDQVSFNGDSVVSTFGVGDTIFVKAGFGNGTMSDSIAIIYDMYPAEDDGISLGAVLRSWDFGSQEGSVVNDTSQDNPDSDNDSDSGGLPSIGVFGTLASIGLGLIVINSRRDD
tara:strand:- start:87 stop:572 length:486 start_codon:yes stop_codon:yes gene_type:complete